MRAHTLHSIFYPLILSPSFIRSLVTRYPFYMYFRIIFGTSLIWIESSLLVLVFRYFAQIAMEISPHFVQLQLYWCFDLFSFHNGVNTWDGLLANLSDFLLDAVLIQLNDGWGSILGAHFFGVEYFESPPRSPPGVNLAFVSIGK